MNSTRERRHFTGLEKVAILRRHLVDKVPVSDLSRIIHTPVFNTGNCQPIGVFNVGIEGNE